MHDASFITELGIALVAALIGGLIARLLKLPSLIGFLLAGVAIGPYTPGFIADQDVVQSIANLGVALLMFAVGVQFSLKELEKVKVTAILGGSLQIVGTIGMGFLLAQVLGWGWYAGLFLGCALALSSTAVMMRILEEKGELGSTHGEIMLGILVVQDLSLVLMVTMLPALGGNMGMLPILKAMGSAAAFIAATLLVATKLAPPLMALMARMRSPELLILTSLCFCLLMAAAAEYAGLGMALGAFLAGVVVSESPYSHEVFAQVRPLRDVFSSLFFVSVGMLLDPKFLGSQILTVCLVVVAIVVGKALISAASVAICGWHARTSITVGLGLAQIGEFSFVLAMMGASKGLVDNEISKIILSAALITLLLAPFVFGAAGPLYLRLDRSARIGRFMHRKSRRGSMSGRIPEQPPRVIILGAGRVGRYVSDSLRAKDISQLCIDIDSGAIRRLIQNDVPVIYGDGSSIDVLRHAHPAQSELVVVALPEASMTEMAVRNLRSLAPNLQIAARVRRGDDIKRMRDAGADVVIHGEFEAGAEMIRQSLDRLGLSLEEVDSYVEEVRAQRYREEPASELGA